MTDLWIDPYSQAVCLLEPFINGQKASHATSFLWRVDEKCYVVTNWHVLSGRSTHTGQPLLDHGGCPTSIKCKVQIKKPNGKSALRSINETLVDEAGENRWLQHPKLGQDVDIAAVRIEADVGSDTLIALNDIQQTENMNVDIGQEVYILGYPLDPKVAGPLPIWKRGSVASEPALPVQERPCLLVDTATREGMSGAPVIAMSWGRYQDLTGRKIVSAGRFCRLLGVYSGRLGADKLGEVQLGVTWWADLISDICSGDARGSYRLR
jgi:hypothetical protein